MNNTKFTREKDHYFQDKSLKTTQLLPECRKDHQSSVLDDNIPSMFFKINKSYKISFLNRI